MTRRLVEQWFPTAQVGAESLRERGIPRSLPPTNFLHIWWARRPLVASRAALLLSLLPAWPTPQLEVLFPEGEEQYHQWVTKALGILGDSVAGRKAVAKANEDGIKLKGNGYGTVRAFTVSPDASTLEMIDQLLVSKNPVVLDPFSGGGSIPFEAMRYGFSVVANELNPVAAAILSATIDIPFARGAELSTHIETFGTLWADRVRRRLERFFPVEDGATIGGYIWARTVPCPTTGYATPLAPNCWLASDGKKAAFELVPNRETGTIDTVIREGSDAASFGDRSTYKNGIGVSVWDNGTFGGDYIRSCAQAGKMSEVLLAIAIDKGAGRQFRAPLKVDLDAISDAETELSKCLPFWEGQDLIPTEIIPDGYTTGQPQRMGITRWRQMFTSRQLLTNATILEELRQICRDAIEELGEELGKAVALYLALSFDRCLDYNSNFTMWDPSFVKIAHVFADHNFAVTTTFAEFEGARALLPWSVGKQTIDAYLKLTKLTPKGEPQLFQRSYRPPTIINGSATNLASLANESVDAIITDPPYGKNVMYAESSDFFYVWLKRALRSTWPEYCSLDLTDKEREAVSNPALFKDLATRKGARKKGDGGHTAVELAKLNYDRLLTAAFREAHRVLKEDGIMTVMFTNKEVDMWDTLGRALLDSGFTIESSWPVESESETSLRIAKKNAARAAIFLACRKRKATKATFWNDIKNEVSLATEEAVRRFAKSGLFGIDLTVSTYGPALSILSHHWPVYTGNTTPDGMDEVISPDAALNLAREKVTEIKKRGLLDGRAMDFDSPTDWYLIAWSDFRARQFPAGEALKLSMAMHLDLDSIAKSYRLCVAKSGWVEILTPAQRRAAGAFTPSMNSYSSSIDALHALMIVLDEEGLNGARAWLGRTTLNESETFKALIAAALKAVPRTKRNGIFILPEAKALDLIRATLFDMIPPPQDDSEQLVLI